MRALVAAALLLAPLAAAPAHAGEPLPPPVVNPTLFNSDDNLPPVDEAPGLTSVITSSTPQASETLEDAFGNADGAIETNTFIFGDGGATADNGNATLGDGGETVDFLEWTTSEPVTIRGYHLTLTNLDPFDRTTQLVEFRVEGVQQDLFDNDGASGVDNATFLEITRPFALPVVGTTFRLSVTRNSNGPRVAEIDALTTSFCGNTSVEPGETCDDGNTVLGDGCDAACQLEPACPATPELTCVAAAKASVSVNETKPGKEKLTAKLQAFAQATAQADLGNPVSGDTRYALCLYGPEDALAGQLSVAEAGEECGPKSKPCWKDKGGKGWAYKDPEADASGVRSLALSSGAAGKGKIQLKAGNNEPKGRDEMPIGIAASLESASNATVQLRISDGLCFSAALDTIKKAQGGVFQAKAP